MSDNYVFYLINQIVSPESGADVGVLERGELCVRCSVMFLRYQHQPSHTAQVRNSQGLLPTGIYIFLENCVDG